MVRRKGLGTGSGKGYKNIIGKDSSVHSQSAKGIKQPTAMNESRLNSMDKQKINPRFDRLITDLKGLNKEYSNLEYFSNEKLLNEYNKLTELGMKGKLKDLEEFSRIGNELTMRGLMKETNSYKNHIKKDELEKEYRQLLDRDINDESIGIENIRIKKRMNEIEDIFRKEEKINKPLNLKRVVYGSSDTKPEDREYQIDGEGAVGTLKEFKEKFPNRKLKVKTPSDVTVKKKFMQNPQGEYMFVFDWGSDGWNSEWAKTKEEALKKAKKSFGDVRNIKKVTNSEYDNKINNDRWN